MCVESVLAKKGLLQFTSSSSLAGKSFCDYMYVRGWEEEQKWECPCSSQSDKTLRCRNKDDIIGGLSGLPTLTAI
jgi:hypothetical protein